MNILTQAQQLILNSVHDLSSFVLNFLAFLVIALILFLFGVRAGRGSLIAFALSLYVGFALYSVFPYASFILGIAAGSAVLIPTIKIVLFFILSLLGYGILKRLTGRDYFGQSRFSNLIISLLTSGFIIALLYHTLSAKEAYAFTPSIDQLFAPSQYFFWWFIAPLVAIFFLGR